MNTTRIINFPFSTPPSAIRVNEKSVAFIFEFENGYGASVVRDDYAGKGLYELAVLERCPDTDSWNICYTSPIKSDVMGSVFSPLEVDELLERIKQF